MTDLGTAALSVITVGIDPTIELGPITLAWHGLTIALGILAGAALAGRYARERGLSNVPLYDIGIIAAIAGLVGGKLFWVAEQGALDEPARWFTTTGFTFYGGFLLAAVSIFVYIRRKGIDLVYLDVAAVGLPIGVAIGRIGDVINGEHYGPPSNWLLAVRNTHPDAGVPSPDIAYHSGGMYEVVLGLLIFAVVWPLRHRVRTRLMLLWLVVALFAAGRFAEFFFRSDSQEGTLGLVTTQWVSLVILAGAGVGAAVTMRRRARG